MTSLRRMYMYKARQKSRIRDICLQNQCGVPGHLLVEPECTTATSPSRRFQRFNFNFNFNDVDLRAPKSLHIANLICRTEPQQKRLMKKTKTKNRDAQKKRTSHKAVESVLRPEGSLWWERFVKKVGLEPGVKERGSYGW